MKLDGLVLVAISSAPTALGWSVQRHYPMRKVLARNFSPRNQQSLGSPLERRGFSTPPHAAASGGMLTPAKQLAAKVFKLVLSAGSVAKKIVTFLPMLLLRAVFWRPAAVRAAAESGGWALDFTDSSVAGDWRAVDDRIMGGSSKSQVVHTDGITSFQGDLVVEGGGFASVRYGKELALSNNVEELVLEAKGDGRLGYKVTLTTSIIPGGVSYQYLLPPLESKDFTKVRLPLKAFKPSQQGRPVPDAPPLQAANIRLLGLMLSRYEIGGEGVKESIQPGGFQLQLRRLAAL
mmetsp:Transcript_16578/g.32897  ORF Transcript_16578/g.32897 Transcript_16578/m.32897 type:complete len:291 (-) Transcript_16578:175-1047(-)